MSKISVAIFFVASIHFPLAREDPAEENAEERLLKASIHFPLAREDAA